jgi:hypothetical protein
VDRGKFDPNKRDAALCSKWGFLDLTTASKNMAAFWDVASCILVEVFRRFRGAITLMMEAASTSETSVNFTRLHGATSQKTIFVLTAVRTSNPTYLHFVSSLHIGLFAERVVCLY